MRYHSAVTTTATIDCVLTIAGIAQGQGKEIAEQMQQTNALVTVNDGSNDDDNNDNNDDDEAIWESLDSDAAVVLLCVGCEDEVHLACRGLAAVPDGDWFCRACQPAASAKAAARLLPATEQVHEADIERKQEDKKCSWW